MRKWPIFIHVSLTLIFKSSCGKVTAIILSLQAKMILATCLKFCPLMTKWVEFVKFCMKNSGILHHVPANNLIVQESHAAIFDILHKIRQFQILPDEYILKRWTKSAKSSVMVANSSVEISVDKSVLERLGKLFQQYSHLIDKVILNDDANKLFCEAMDAVNEKIKPLVGGTNENVEPSTTKGYVECRAKRKSIVDDVGFLEPDPVKTKGSRKRLKKGKEKGKCKKRVNGNLCHGCGQYEVKS